MPSKWISPYLAKIFPALIKPGQPFVKETSAAEIRRGWSSMQGAPASHSPMRDGDALSADALRRMRMLIAGFRRLISGGDIIAGDESWPSPRSAPDLSLRSNDDGK